MDFLKSCTTNVRVVDGLAGIPCEAFTLRDGGSRAERSRRLYGTMGKLREGNILCALDGQRLDVFGYKLDETTAALKDIGYDGAVVGEDGKASALLQAIEASLAYKLAADGLTHVAPWTWLFSGHDDREDGAAGGSTLVELHAKLGGNGALFVSSTVRNAPFIPVRSCTEKGGAAHCLLAPSGTWAKVGSGAAGDGKPVVGNAAWKAGIGETLRAEGVELAEDEHWMEVQLDQDGDLTRLLWPSRLCFRSADPRDTASPTDTEYWKPWFGPTISQDDPFRDPLAAAEEWITRATQLSAAIPGDEPPTTDNNAPPAVPDATPDLVTSPPFSQRTADQQAAMGGIYPTPPDGLLPGTQGTQPLPPSDGNTMPPINESSELLPGEEMEGLRQSISSSNAPEGGFQRSDDDLFGDMGEMDFGGNEVGDADFDYFDEPDEETGDDHGPSHDIGDVDMTDGIASHQPDEAEQVEHELAADGEAHGPAEMDQDAEPAVETQDGTSVGEDTAEVQPAPFNRDDIPDTEKPKKSDRPLSPFGIRERLLPPPIPASTIRAESEKGGNLRRSSAYGPVTFNDGLGLAAKYGSEGITSNLSAFRQQKTEADTSLPPTAKKSRPKNGDGDADSDGSDEDSSTSGADSGESETSVSDAELPHKLPWESRKRKRAVVAVDDGEELAWMKDFVSEDRGKADISVEKMSELRMVLLRSYGSDTDDQSKGAHLAPGRIAVPAKNGLHADQAPDDDELPPVDQLYDELDDLDLVYTAQLISEQSVSVVPRLVEEIKYNTAASADEEVSAAIDPLFEQALNSILPTASACDLTKIALPREPPRPLPSASGKGPHPVPRPPQRADSVQQQQGPDCCLIPPPYIRVQRYGDAVEMLPPALHFWGTLGLGPANGAKDVRVVSVVPGNADLAHSVQSFIGELRLVYEANKLGSWKRVSGLRTSDPEDDLVLHDDSTVLVQPHIAPGEPVDAADILQSYALTCDYLGQALAAIGHEDADRTIVVCIVSPFKSVRAQQALCACFWMLYKAYRDNTPKAQRTAARSDIVLRILPVDILANADGLVILDQRQLASLAMELYDRCPPSAKQSSSKDIPAALTPFFAAPAIELALPLPRRIPFQLTADPPSDLLHENSVLHLAYTVCKNGEWMCFSWIDGSGRFAGNLAMGLRGRTIRAGVEEVWERIVSVGGGDGGWGGRVYVVGVGGGEAAWGTSVRDCWRAAVARKPRRTVLHVTLLDIDLEPELQLIPPSPPPTSAAGTGDKGAGQGFLTPVTTPSGTGAGLTVSPDASAAAPPTPAPSDPAESEGETQLVELADESWGLMLSSAFTATTTSTPSSQSSSQPLASGMLLRRGSAPSSAFPANEQAEKSLEALAVNLYWDIRVRPNGTVDEGPARQAEFTLREVLRLFRGLGVLGRARGLNGGGGRGGGAVPVHVEGVLGAREGLEGMMV